MSMRYFDHNATTPLSQEAKTAWLEVVDGYWMNPSSPYRKAASAKVRLDLAREELADLFQVEPERVVFCSGATEANNAVFCHWAQHLPDSAKVAVSPTEHSSVIESAKAYFGGRVIWLPVDENGVVVLEALNDMLDTGAVSAVSVMAANNETGVLQPWSIIAERCLRAGVDYHCDASQWVGKLALSGLSHCSYMTACAHKFGGPKGIGFMLIPDANDTFCMLHGGQQESGRRAGTEDLAAATAMLAALKSYEPRDSAASVAFLADMQQRIEGLNFIGGHADRLWNTVSLIMPNFQSVRWIRALEKKGYFVSSGSACSANQSSVSHVLASMGIEPALAGRVLRISSGFSTTPECWEGLADALYQVYAQLIAESTDLSTRVISLD